MVSENTTLLHSLNSSLRQRNPHDSLEARTWEGVLVTPVLGPP